MEKLIRALRCFATVQGEVFKCAEDCPYRLIEEVTPDLPVTPDVITNGVGYLTSCDYDRIALDAAEALEKLKKFQWIPVKVRPTTEEDEIDMMQYPSYLDFPMPDEGQEILISSGDIVDKDTNMTDDGTSYYLDGCGDWAGVDAWMPLPEPYKKEE